MAIPGPGCRSAQSRQLAGIAGRLPSTLHSPSCTRIGLVAMRRSTTPICRRFLAWLIFCWAFAMADQGRGQDNAVSEGVPPERSAPEWVDFFERRIRPQLVEHCQSCHAADTEREGGLLLDSRDGWQTGGDSGAAIIPGDADASRLYRVIAGTDPDLEMPPDGKLPAAVIADFQTWIDGGAIDPREAAGSAQPAKPPAAIDWAVARQHWAYRPLVVAPVPTFVAGQPLAEWPRGPIDAFILRDLLSHDMAPNPPAARTTLLRRLHLDLTGLPPTPDQVREFIRAEDELAAYERSVDALIASQDFAERFARHWLDVARFAESVTLRGLVQPEAWRYRDYVIDALRRDRSWRDVLCEQIAGDQLKFDSLEQARQAAVAVTFLCLGDMNLENQQKRELDMDFIDEQLDTLGRGILGQTLSCARCHDHKFDPIPTSDYYALAGILHGSVGLEHANVSRWIENPLPMDPAEQAHFAALQRELDETKAELQVIKQKLAGVEAPTPRVVDSVRLAGVVVDDAEARRVGNWMQSVHTQPYVDAGYLHDEHTGIGEKSLTFEPRDLPAGRYELRIAYGAGANRSTKVPVTVFSADGETTVTVNQRTPPTIDGLWESLGKFRFEAGGQAFVMIGNQETDGHVIGDAIQFLPLDGNGAVLATTRDGGNSDDATGTGDRDQPEPAETEAWKRTQQELTARQNVLQKQLAEQPRAMGLRPRDEAGDLAVHIRGSIHQLGPKAPRGVLRVISGDDAVLTIPQGSDGRLELARWIASDENPLTARVLVNRVWLWVMGEGLVRTPDNFGTTGQPPTHPELLDWLTARFIREGWSIQRLVKQIVMSETYRQSSLTTGVDDPRLTTDPDNRWWWRSDRKPLSAESLRDSVLAISGQLDRTFGGSRIKPGTSADYGYRHEDLVRSIYLPVFRNALPELLETFNYADTGSVTGRRQRTIVAQHALAILNHPWFAERSIAAAERNFRETSGDLGQQIEHAFLQTLGRSPEPLEAEAAVEFYEQTLRELRVDGAPLAPGSVASERSTDSVRALAEVYRGLFATAEFRRPD